MKKASATGDGDVPLCVREAARKWPERNGEMTERAAAAYVELALWAIRLAEKPAALRQWWTDEQGHREEYGLSQAQIDRLVKACREHIGRLEGQRTITPSRSLEPDQRSGQPKYQRARRRPGGALETGVQSPDYRTGWSVCDGIKFLEGGCPC